METVWDMERYTGQTVYDAATNVAMGFKRTIMMGSQPTVLDDYDPLLRASHGLQFDGLQYLRNFDIDAMANYYSLKDKENLFSIECWFKMNTLRPQGDNIGWLFMQHMVGQDPISGKYIEGVPIFYGIGVTGQNAVAALDDRVIFIPEVFDGNS